MIFTIIYNRADGRQHTAQCDDEQLAKVIVSQLRTTGRELVFYPMWDDNGVFTEHKN